MGNWLDVCPIPSITGLTLIPVSLVVTEARLLKLFVARLESSLLGILGMPVEKRFD